MKEDYIQKVERHPLQPFLPTGAKLLILGSFPPPKMRWCMPFYYPNPQNDMWRIMGQVFFGDKMRFVNPREVSKNGLGGNSVFKYKEIVAFCEEKGIAIFDTAQAVIRLRDNAADEHLQIVEPTDIAVLLHQLPYCHDICCTGQKAADILADILGCLPPKIGTYSETEYIGRRLRFWRMPSSSRAYPLPFEKKVEAYSRMMQAIGLK